MEAGVQRGMPCHPTERPGSSFTERGRRPGACHRATRRVRDAVIVRNLAGASTAVTVLWKISGLTTRDDKSHGAALVCALLICAVMYFISETDPRRGPMNLRDYVIEGVVALVQPEQGRSRAGSAALADCYIVFANAGMHHNRRRPLDGRIGATSPSLETAQPRTDDK